jgi:cell wall-associated NlpC family hydrolase
MMAWRAGGVSLEHLASAQYGETARIPASALQPGDLVFFGDGGNIGHVGLYVGGGTMIDAPFTGVDVRYDSIGGAFAYGRV